MNFDSKNTVAAESGPEGLSWVLDGPDEYGRLLDSSRGLLARWRPEELKALDLDRENLGSGRIRITVFGLMKSGKSTLCNALLGRRAAAVGVPPVTDRVAEYDYRGALLVDTPGTEARPEETARAFRAVRESNLLLVVIGWGVSKVSQRAVWDPLTRALDEAGGRNIPVIFVIHDLDARLFSPSPAVGTTDREIVEEVRRLAAERKIPFRVQVCNGEEYLEKRLDGSGDDAFFARTGIPELERTLCHILASSDAVLRVVRPLRGFVSSMRAVESDVRERLARLGEEAARLALQVALVEKAGKAAVQEMARALAHWREGLIRRVDAAIDSGGPVDGKALQAKADQQCSISFKDLETKVSTRISELGRSWSPLDSMDRANLNGLVLDLGIPAQILQSVGIGKALLSIKPINALVTGAIAKMGLSSAAAKASSYLIPGLAVVGVAWTAFDILKLFGGGRSGAEIAEERESLKRQIREKIEQSATDALAAGAAGIEEELNEKINRLRASGPSAEEQSALEEDLMEARRRRAAAEAALLRLARGFAEEESREPGRSNPA